MEPFLPDVPDSEDFSAAELAEHVQDRPSGAEESAWRDELSVRLQRYRTRHKAPPPRYPSLRLPFDPLECRGKAVVGSETSSQPAFESFSSHALALDGMQPNISSLENVPVFPPAPEISVESAPQSLAQPKAQTGAKIIEFPRFAWAPPPPPLDQLAEPVIDKPRILEVPEVAPPPPALGGITIEPPPREEIERRPGIDIPLQSAPLGLRLVASLIDGMIIAAASALFGLIFWKVTFFRPPQIQLIGLATGILCLFWAAYQYLLIIYAANTPGLRLARLELTRFDGSPTTRSLRRWRVLASWLSAVSLGMGYAWVFLDEDVLCWHDRITHTYLAPIKKS